MNYVRDLEAPPAPPAPQAMDKQRKQHMDYVHDLVEGIVAADGNTMRGFVMKNWGGAIFHRGREWNVWENFTSFTWHIRVWLYRVS